MIAVEELATPTLSAETLSPEIAVQANWVTNATLLWEHRRLLARVTAIAFAVGVILAFVVPKQYESVARIMPPDQPNTGLATLAALAGHSLGGLGGFGSLAGSLLSGKTSGALFIDLLHSRTVSDRVIDRFDLQQVYRKRYRIDTVKYLARHTKIADDKKSGVITITFTDTDPERARAITQAYLEELNKVVNQSNTSSARRERQFIEKRLVSAQAELQDAQKALSEFSSTNSTIDIKEQTHAMVDAGAKLQAELIVGQAELNSLEQIYGNDNVRVRAARARIGVLQHELTKMSGSSAAPSEDASASSDEHESSLYPPLRQLPRLAVPYANLYRRVRIQETVFELLSQQYEMSRIQEAKDTPAVSVIDPPLLPEKKSFPPRVVLILMLTAISGGVVSVFIICRHLYAQVQATDPRKMLAENIARSVIRHLRRDGLNRGEPA